MRRVALHILGRVQGVFYRHNAQREARKLGLTGFILNDSDGSVRAEAEGPPEKIGEFIRWCRRGPPNAVVEDVKVRELNPTGKDEEFEVRY